MPFIKELRCSRYLSFLALFMIPFPVAYLIFSVLIFDLDSKGLLSIALSPLFWLASIFWIFTGLGIKRLEKWSWYTFALAQVFITYVNALTLVQLSNSEFKVWAFFFTLLIQFYVYVVIAKELRVPFLFPKINWWESGLAGIPSLEAKINHLSSAEGGSLGQILDINNRGCFVKTHLDFSPFEKITIHLDQFGHKVDLHGFVAWKAKSTVTHPKGIGVCFVELGRQKRRKVRVISQRFLKQKKTS